MTSEQVAQLRRCLERGELGLFGADTVYGLACDPHSRVAVERLYTLKQRARDQPAAVMFFDLESALDALDPPPRTGAALRALLPGALTVLLPNPGQRFPLACAGVPSTLGVRVPRLEGRAAALRELSVPVLQSSANLSGGCDPRRLDEVEPAIRAGVCVVLDAGELPGVASTVVDLRDFQAAGSWSVVREGAVAREALEGALSSTTMSDELAPDYFDRPLADVDPEIAEVLGLELERQQNTLEMIASENFVPQAVLECQGSVLTNKYAEGLPGRRYYGGCEHVDTAERLAISRACELFGADYANVQPHSGAQANAAAYHALLEPGDKVLGLDLAHGGHLTHGMAKNVSGRLYDVVAYHVRRDNERVDMEEVERLAAEHRPKLIIAGWSAYSRHLDFARFRAIADQVGAYLMTDMAHFAGLVAAGLHPNPMADSHVVTTTIHKTLGGARGGMILSSDEEIAKKLNSAVFPGQQGGPLEHVIAGKAVALKIAQSELFRERQRRTIAGAQAVAEQLLGAGGGVSVLTGGTDVHLVLVDLRESKLDGQQAEDRLAEIGITVNRNAVPFDPRPPMVSSGLRVGSSALATRGLQVPDFGDIGAIMATALSPGFEDARDELTQRTAAIAERYPLYAHLTTPALA